MTMIDDAKEKNNLDETFVRWQRLSMEQLGFVNNLLLGLSVGLIAFQDKVLSCSMISLGGSVIFGVLTAWSRLFDIRYTMYTVLERKAKHPGREKINDLRCLTKVLGKLTWGLLMFQTFAFVWGLIVMLCAMRPHSVS